MRHHAERVARIRRLLAAVEAQQAELQAMIETHERISAELRSELDLAARSDPAAVSTRSPDKKNSGMIAPAQHSRRKARR
jgi:hypothetical protein